MVEVNNVNAKNIKLFRADRYYGGEPEGIAAASNMIQLSAMPSNPIPEEVHIHGSNLPEGRSASVRRYIRRFCIHHWC
jgi:hypothetical protein